MICTLDTTSTDTGYVLARTTNWQGGDCCRKKVWGYKGDNNPDCAIKTCGNKAKVGGHVCYNTPPGEVYIIPICGQCNSTSKDETAKVLKKECDGHRELVRAIKQK